MSNIEFKPFSARYLDRQLSSAIRFKSLRPTSTPLTPTHECVGSAVNSMIECIELEANESYSNKLSSNIRSPLLHVVNMSSDNPGIISQFKSNKCTIHRFGNKSNPPSDDTSSNVTKPSLSTKSKEQLIIQAQKKQSKLVAKQNKCTKELETKAIKKMEKKQNKPPKEKKAKQPSAREVLARKIKKADKQLKSTTDDDERASILATREELVKELEAKNTMIQQKKQACKERKELQKQKSTVIDADESALFDNYNMDAENKDNHDVPLVDVPLVDVDDVDDVDKVDSVPMVDDVDDVDAVDDVDNVEQEKINKDFELHDKTLPIESCVSVDASIDDVEVYASPILYTRHIDALSHCNPNDIFVPTLLYGHPIDKKFLEIIHGPPGTGKTYTIIERLKTLLTTTQDKILVTAPSNVGVINLYNRAVDAKLSCTLVMSKAKLPPNTIIKENITNNRPNNRIYFSTVSMRNSRLIANKQFHTVILDEAAQCPECWTWGLFRKEVCRFIMAGDPCQLPSTVSETGQNLNHHISLMERLMSLGVESTLLSTQRRMHPDIVAFPNDEFYAGKLDTIYTNYEGDDGNNTQLDSQMPFKTINVDGQEQQQGTSYYNHQEAIEAIEQYNQYSAIFKTVVIIVPYRAQQQHLLSIDDTLHVHTVDSFQGQEADAVIITTVRTSTMGFWQDHRRINVAMTRARHVLRLIGNFEAWNTNPIFRKLVQ